VLDTEETACDAASLQEPIVLMFPSFSCLKSTIGRQEGCFVPIRCFSTLDDGDCASIRVGFFMQGDPNNSRRERGRTDIFVGELVAEAYSLRLVLHRLAVDDGLTEILYNGLVDCIALGLCVSLGQEERVVPIVEYRRLTKSSTVHLPCRKTTGDV